MARCGHRATIAVIAPKGSSLRFFAGAPSPLVLAPVAQLMRCWCALPMGAGRPTNAVRAPLLVRPTNVPGSSVKPINVVYCASRSSALSSLSRGSHIRIPSPPRYALRDIPIHFVPPAPRPLRGASRSTAGPGHAGKQQDRESVSCPRCTSGTRVPAAREAASRRVGGVLRVQCARTGRAPRGSLVRSQKMYDS